MHDAHVFAQAFTVYNYDRRGRGDSGNTLPYSMEREIEDIEAIIEAGWLRMPVRTFFRSDPCLEAAMRLGDKVNKAVLYDPAYAHDEADQLEFKGLIQGLNQSLEGGKHDEAISLF